MIEKRQIAGHVAAAAACILIGTSTTNAASITLIAQAGPVVEEQDASQTDTKAAQAERVADGWREDSYTVNIGFLGGVDLFGLNEFAKSRYRAIANSDPWMYFQYEFTNLTDVSLFYSLDVRMETERTAGPTMKDTFLSIELFDNDDNGLVMTSNTYASTTVTEDNDGPMIVDTQTLGASPPPGGQTYLGEGTHTVFDETGVGPNSNEVVGASGYNRMRFLSNSSLSPRDTVRLTGFACYADTLDKCPTRPVLSLLDLDDPVASAEVPLPAPILMLISALGGLSLLARRRSW